MEPREVIKAHLQLCEEVHKLLLEENTWLKREAATNHGTARTKTSHSSSIGGITCQS